jgi:hypothetical protein
MYGWMNVLLCVEMINKLKEWHVPPNPYLHPTICHLRSIRTLGICLGNTLNILNKCRPVYFFQIMVKLLTKKELTELYNVTSERCFKLKIVQERVSWHELPQLDVYSFINTFLFRLFCIFSGRLECVGHSFGNIALFMIFEGCLDTYPA